MSASVSTGTTWMRCSQASRLPALGMIKHGSRQGGNMIDRMWKPVRGVVLTLGLTLPALAGAQTPAAGQGDPAFDRCLQSIALSAREQGIAAEQLAPLLAGLSPDRSVLALLDRQPEFTTPVWDYLAALVDTQRIDDGRQRLAEHAGLLQSVEAAYGVPAATVVAVWGVESDYGRVFGQRPLLQSLATLACEGRRQAFFRSELLALLRLLAAGDLSAEGLTGSWAGAFGHTQFMPSTYARIAVDGDGDGRRDLVASIPDAFRLAQRPALGGGDPLAGRL